MKEQIIDLIKEWKPLADRVVVLPVEKEKETESGLKRTNIKYGEDNQFGQVISVGAGRASEYSGTIMPMTLKENDIVMFSRHAGDRIFIDESGNIYPALRDKRDEWLLVVILREDSCLLHKPYAA